MIQFITENWQTILCVAFAVISGGLIAWMYHKNKLNEQNIGDIAYQLDMLDDGEGVVAILAGYAKKAVMAVEQMVKAGIIPKENVARKAEAATIVKELAEKDGLCIDSDDGWIIGNLIETSVYEMQNK